MRILAIDYGKKRFGLAISDPLGLTAQGLPTLVSQGRKCDLEKIKEIVGSKGVEKIVVGLPRKMDGTIGQAAKEVLTFVEELRRHLGLPVITWDERLTTKRAEREMISADLSRAKRKSRQDKIAAQFILQNFLDAQHRREG